MKLILLVGALSFPVIGMAEKMPNQSEASISQQNGKVTGTVEDDLGTVIERLTEPLPTLTDDSP